MEGISVVIASASIAACSFITLSLTGMAGLALPVTGALAGEVIHQVNAVPTMFARVVSALVDIEVTESTLPAVRTQALKGVHSVDAGPTILTRVADAVVDIFMTVDAAETRITDAGEVASWVADAAPTWTANIGWNVLYSS